MKRIIFCYVLLIVNAWGLDVLDQKLKHAIDKGDRTFDESIIDKNNPYFIPFNVVKTINSLGYIKDEEVIKNLEELILNNEFKGQVSSNEFKIGTNKSYTYWRNFIYSALARSYYHQKDYVKAEYYYRGIEPKTELATMTYLEYAWTALALQDKSKASKIISLIEDDIEKRLDNDEKKEFDLIKMYFYALNDKFDKAIELGKTINIKNNRILLDQWHKTYAQTYFSKYLKDGQEADFKEKVALLQNIHKHAEKISSSERDPYFSFLAGESYWHLASQYRIKDPIKNKSLAQNLLSKANLWMSPWVEKSMAKEKAYISEEAMFFSIALVWENEDFKSAIARLKALPKLFPQGEYLEDSYQLLGDYYFESKSFNSAIVYYRKLAAGNEPQKAAYGVYKAAWSFYNLNDKWKALRHFERLMLFYNDQDKEFFKNDKVGLFKESKRDFVTVMAELLDFKTAYKELKLFKLDKEETKNYLSDLGYQYQKIGRFNESIKTWRYLLKSYTSDKQNLSWLKELLSTHLSAGYRAQISKDLNAYYPKIKSNVNYDKKDYKSFQDELGAIILTVHKEARKSDDLAIWKAIDGLYSAYINYFENSSDGKIWYFGAQRQERLGRKIEAVNWYKQASLIKEYENKDDAAHSVVRLLKDLSDKLGLVKTIGPNQKKVYAAIEVESRWFFETFKKDKAARLAEILHIDALSKLNKTAQINIFIKDIFSQDKITDYKKNLFSIQNKVYYEEKKWQEANLLSKTILDFKDKIPSEWKQKIQEIYQETAFLKAFELEEQLKKSPAKEREQLQTNMRRWYDLAATELASAERSVKAWHNLILSFSPINERDLYLKRLDQFDEIYKTNKKEFKRHEDIIFNMYAHGIRAYDEAGLDLEKARLLVKSAPFIKDKAKLESALWESVLLFGTYQDFKQVDIYLTILNKRRSSYLKTPANLNIISKLYYQGGQYDKSWKYFKHYLKTDQVSLNGWILFYDLYNQIGSENNEIKKYIKDNVKELRQISVLTPMWENLSSNNAKTLVNYWNETIKKRKPTNFKSANVLKFMNATSSKKKTKLTRAELATTKMKMVLSEITDNLKEMDHIKGNLKKFINPWQPKVSKQAVCLASEQTMSTMKRLKSLTTLKISSAQWPELVSRIRSKNNDLNNIVKEEDKLCKTYTKKLYALGGDSKKSPLCDYGPCPKMRKLDSEEIASFERKNKKKLKSKDVINDELFFAYLKLGAFARAQWLLTSITDTKLKSLYLGVLRLAHNDKWNAWSLLREAATDKRFTSEANLYSAMILIEGGHKDEAKEYLRKVNGRSLASRPKENFKEVLNTYRD